MDEFVSGKCKDCGEVFVIEPGERTFFESRDMQLPKRCKACRISNRKRRDAETRARGDDQGS
jgi:hypothetical protein